jgi:hypothetical protein
MSDLRAYAETSNAWPFVEARSVLKRVDGKTPKKGYVLFETGYGPSGLPHIGTFGEVARTSMVRHAFAQLSTSRRACSRFPTTWTGCARFLTIFLTRRWWRSTSASR